MPRTVSREKLDEFVGVYHAELTKAVAEHPEDYGYSVENVPGVVVKMRRAFEDGTYNCGGRAIRAACRTLGIKHTRASMELYFSAEEN